MLWSFCCSTALHSNLLATFHRSQSSSKTYRHQVRYTWCLIRNSLSLRTRCCCCMFDQRRVDRSWRLPCQRTCRARRVRLHNHSYPSTWPSVDPCDSHDTCHWCHFESFWGCLVFSHNCSFEKTEDLLRLQKTSFAHFSQVSPIWPPTLQTFPLFA